MLHDKPILTMDFIEQFVCFRWWIFLQGYSIVRTFTQNLSAQLFSNAEFHVVLKQWKINLRQINNSIPSVIRKENGFCGLFWQVWSFSTRFVTPMDEINAESETTKEFTDAPWIKFRKYVWFWGDQKIHLDFYISCQWENKFWSIKKWRIHVSQK